ncbi:MAG: hypothetical protein KAW14_06360 [Candidatus Aegiribacteria sp.]|nr:hypothetical protein [Candidatus Aegiribacteria sp.]
MKYALCIVALVATLSFAGSTFDGGCADTFGISGYTKAWIYMFGAENNDPANSFRAYNWTGFTGRLNDNVYGFVGTQFKTWDGNSSLQICDAYLNMNIIPELSIRAGQFKVPFGWAYTSSGGGQYFLDRAALAGTEDFTNFGGRDVGIKLHGEFDMVGIDVAYFNGTGAYSDADTVVVKEIAALLTVDATDWLTIAGGVTMIGEAQLDSAGVVLQEKWNATGIDAYILADYPISDAADLIFEGEFLQAGWIEPEVIGGEGKAGMDYYAMLGVNFDLEESFIASIMPAVRYETLSPSYFLVTGADEPKDNTTVMDFCVNCYLTPANTIQIGGRNYSFEADGVDGYTDMYLGWRMNF